MYTHLGIIEVYIFNSQLKTHISKYVYRETYLGAYNRIMDQKL